MGGGEATKPRSDEATVGLVWVRLGEAWVCFGLKLGSFWVRFSGEAAFLIAPVRKVGFVWDTFFSRLWRLSWLGRVKPAPFSAAGETRPAFPPTFVHRHPR